MRHRHLDWTDDVPVAERGPAALDEALERGDLADWAPLARAVAADPRGALADRILGLVEANPQYGSAPLWRTWLLRLRDRTPTGPVPLAKLRRQAGLRQRDLAERLGVRQPDVSKLEARGDVRVSTLRAYVAATGGELGLVARYPDHDVEVCLCGRFEPRR